MPLMVEPLVMKTGYAVNGDIEKIVPLVRQAVELGADIIKADPTDERRGLPPRDRGGRRAARARARRRPRPRRGGARPHARADGQGAAGIVYGRNVIQHEDPAGDDAQLMAIVHA